MLCLDFGLLDLHRKFVARIQPDEEEAERIKKYVRARFDKAELPEKEVFSTVVLVGATNLALYDIYADFAEKEFDEDRRIRYKTFKKLVKELISGRDRSQLIFNNAPEKLYLAGPAAIVLKVLFKRFGVRDIVVSDRGVKEGFLQAVLDGTERGQYYDFASESVLGTAREEPAAKTGEKVLAKKNPEKTSAEKRSAAAAEGKTAEGKPVPAAGGRRQTASAGRKKNPAPKAAKAAEEKKTSAPRTVKTAEEKSAESADPNESK